MRNVQRPTCLGRVWMGVTSPSANLHVKALREIPGTNTGSNNLTCPAQSTTFGLRKTGTESDHCPHVCLASLWPTPQLRGGWTHIPAPKINRARLPSPALPSNRAEENSIPSLGLVSLQLCTSLSNPEKYRIILKSTEGNCCCSWLGVCTSAVNSYWFQRPVC